MSKLLYRIIIFCTCCCFYVANAQIDENDFIPLPIQTIQEIEENKLVDEAYALYNNDEDLKSYHSAHRLIKKLKTSKAITNANLLLAYYFTKKTLIDSSLYYTDVVLKLNTFTNDSLRNRFYGLTYNLKAINYRNRGLIEESKKWHIKGIEVSQEYKETDLYYTHTHGLAQTYIVLGDYKNALTMFKQCLEHADEAEKVYGSYINMATIYSELKDFDTSNKYLNKANVLCKEDNNKKCQAIIALNLATNYQEQGEINEAVSFYNKSIIISDENEYNRIALIARSNMGKIFIGLGQYKDAELIFSSGLINAIDLGLLNEQTVIYENLMEISILQNNYENAFKLSAKFYKIKDSIRQLQKDKEINELEVKYKTVQKEKEIEVLQVENTNKQLKLKNQEEAMENLNLQKEIIEKQTENEILMLNNSAEKRNNEITLLRKDQELKASEITRQKEMKRITLIAFLLLLIPIVGVIVLYYQKLQTQSLLNKKQKEVSGQKIASLIKDQELKLIKASVQGKDQARKRIAQELHDSIGGNLAAIKLQFGSISNNNTKLNTIYQQLDETYEQVRSLSHNLTPKKFHQNDFIPLVKDYIQNIGGASNINIIVSAYPEKAINSLNEILQNEVFTILQELITNTIKHARAKKIEIQIDIIDNVLNLIFEDNGIGFRPSDTKTGIGLANIENRLQEFKGVLDIDSHPKRGTIINIEIPNIHEV